MKNLQPQTCLKSSGCRLFVQTCLFLQSWDVHCNKALRKPPPATEPFRALRARNPKRVKNESKKSLPGPPVPGAQKSPKRARKESKTSQKGSLLTLFGLFLDFLGPWGQRARETLFWLVFDFLGFRARRARNGSVAGGAFLKQSHYFIVCFDTFSSTVCLLGAL